MSTEKTTNPPVAKGYVGNVHYAIWKHTYTKDGETKNFYKATFEARFKKGDTWDGTHSYSERDLVNLMKASAEAHTVIGKLRREDTQAAEDGSEQADAA